MAIGNGGGGFLNVFGFGKEDKISSDDRLPNQNQNGNDDNGNDRTPPNNNGNFGDDSDDGGEPDLLGDFVDLDNESGDFDIQIQEDEDEEEPELGADGQPIDPDKALVTRMQNQIKGIKLNIEDIPDLDWNDKKAAATFMTGVIQRAVSNAVGVMAMPLEHAMSAQDKRFNKAIQNTGKMSAARQRMENAFYPIGESLRNDKVALAYAKEQFQKAYKKNGGDYAAATRSTAGLLKGLGKIVNLSLKSQSNNTSHFSDDDSSSYSAGPSRREGVAALDHFAPLPKQKSQQRQ